MGMMAKMRSLAPWFILTVGGLFVLFMVLSDSKITTLARANSNIIGEINGEEITYQDFAKMVEQYRKNQVAQTGKDISEDQMDAFRDQVWDALVTQKLIDDKMQEYGITVTDEEIVQLIKGPNPPQILKQYFIDSTGNFNREAYDAAIMDPKNKQAMIEAENLIRQQLLQQKLQDYLAASVIVSEGEIKRKFIDQNIKMSADWALFSFLTIPDSLVTVTDEEIENYYDEHKEEYKLEERRKLKYVLFKKQPSADDSMYIRKNLEAIVEKLQGDTGTFKTYVEIYSDQPYTQQTVALDELPENAANLLYKAKPGAVVGPVLTDEGYIVYRLVKKVKGKDTVVRASHILIKVKDNNEEEAKKKIYEIYNELKKGAEFEKLAREKSEDGTSRFGGDLGWFSKGLMVPEFERVAFRGRIGEILKPVRTQFGYHVIKVTGKTNNKYVIEKIVNQIKPSATTLDEIYNAANDFAYLAKKNDFESEAELMKYKVLETLPFNEDARSIPGIGSSKALLKFTFENSVGDVSDVYKVPTGYVVAMISEILPAGYRPLEEVKAQITRKLKKEKKVDKTMEIAADVKQKIGGDNGDITKVKTYYSKARVSNVKDFTATGTIPGIGRDYAFINYALKGEIGKVSDPVRSNVGSYLIKVTERTKFDSTMYSLQKKFLRDNLLRQKKSQFFNEWVKKLKEEADIVDNRYLFYR